MSSRRSSLSAVMHVKLAPCVGTSRSRKNLKGWTRVALRNFFPTSEKRPPSYGPIFLLMSRILFWTCIGFAMTTIWRHPHGCQTIVLITASEEEMLSCISYPTHSESDDGNSSVIAKSSIQPVVSPSSPSTGPEPLLTDFAETRSILSVSGL